MQTGRLRRLRLEIVPWWCRPPASGPRSRLLNSRHYDFSHNPRGTVNQSVCIAQRHTSIVCLAGIRSNHRSPTGGAFCLRPRTRIHAHPYASSWPLRPSKPFIQSSLPSNVKPEILALSLSLAVLSSTISFVTRRARSELHRPRCVLLPVKKSFGRVPAGTTKSMETDFSSLDPLHGRPQCRSPHRYRQPHPVSEGCAEERKADAA
jgi:hypothetical protein